ncbi:hypothetical protein V2J09_022573 [Rumex salicifolius]
MESPTVVDEERSHSRVTKDEGSRKGGLITMKKESKQERSTGGAWPDEPTSSTCGLLLPISCPSSVLLSLTLSSAAFLPLPLVPSPASWYTFPNPNLFLLTSNRPSSPCGSGSGGGLIKGESATVAQYAILAVAFAVMSIGAGGVRPCSQAYGADQLHINKRDNTNNNKEERALEIFFKWYYACSCLSVLIGVNIQVNAGWRVGVGIPALLLLASIFSFFAASSFYVKVGPLRSLFTSFVHVVVAAYRNRHLQLSPNSRYHHHQRQQNNTHMQAAVSSKYIRALNKACLLSRDCSSSENHPWRLTTVDQVEELKALIRVLPIWSSGIMLSIYVNQVTFQVYQANAMDRQLGSGFEVPASSIGMFLILAIVVWVPLYDRLIIPMASWMKGRPVRISVKLRMGVGLFFTLATMAVAALYALNGIGEALNVIGQTEFYYSEFPKSMSSISTVLSGVGMAVASLMATAIVSAVNAARNVDCDDSWVGDDPNKAHYDYYYMFCTWA